MENVIDENKHLTFEELQRKLRDFVVPRLRDMYDNIFEIQKNTSKIQDEYNVIFNHKKRGRRNLGEELEGTDRRVSIKRTHKRSGE